MVHTTSSSSDTNNKKTTPLFSSSPFKSSLKQAKKQSELLNAIVVQYEQELSRLEAFEQELIEKDALREEVFEKEKQATLQDLAEREERIFNIEKKLSSTTSIETKLGKNQIVKLNVGGKIFATTLETLKSVKDTYFTGYFSDHFQPEPEKDGTFVVNRPFEHFALILNYLRGINITGKIQSLNDDDLNGFIEEVVFYGITPIYDLLPSRGRKILSTKSGMEGWFVKFDPDYCSSKITLDTETRARCKVDTSCWTSVLGTKSNSFKVRLISDCAWLLIGYAPKSIDVNNSEHFRSGYYLHCYNGTLYSQNEDKSYTNGLIEDGSIVECLLDSENGTISYKVDGKCYGVAFSNIPEELYPAFETGGQCAFELLNEP